jgi:NDP-sugar pyrophosphorylase family protein
VLGLGHRAQAVIEHLRARPQTDIDIGTVVEPSPMGTAGAIRFARSELRSNPAMVMNGDSFADADLCTLVDYHRAASATATMLCARVPDAARYGRVELDGGFVDRFIEKDPAFSGAAFINAGVYVLSAALLDSIAAGDARSIEHDVFARLPLRSLAAYTECSKFIDIGTPEALARADEIFSSPLGSSRKQ